MYAGVHTWITNGRMMTIGDFQCGAIAPDFPQATASAWHSGRPPFPHHTTSLAPSIERAWPNITTNNGENP